MAGSKKGREGVGQFFARIGAAVEVKTWEPRHVLAAGSSEVVAAGAWSGIAKPTGKSAQLSAVFRR
ncbi:MAG TPA: nuclear transport factor 2 family protein [Reyranella sp.]|nr:nuclear transport factor 2 family protein [Reyranella sp.]